MIGTLKFMLPIGILMLSTPKAVSDTFAGPQFRFPGLGLAVGVGWDD